MPVNTEREESTDNNRVAPHLVMGDPGIFQA